MVGYFEKRVENFVLFDCILEIHSMNSMFGSDPFDGSFIGICRDGYLAHLSFFVLLFFISLL